MGADLSKVSILARREIEARILSPVIKALMKELGKERALRIVEPIIQSLAREGGANLAKLLGGNTLDHLVKGMSFWTQEEALTLDLREQNPKRFVFNVTRCRYAEMYKELGIPELGNLLSCSRDKALIEGFNSQIKFTRTQTIMEGAKYCDFRYERKD
jgi:fumarate reductase iron-sulfur subunit